jgi:uncharacterized membrane protein (UPF0127 family)
MQEQRRPVVITLLVLGAIALAVLLVSVLDAVGDPEPDAGGIPLSAIISRQKPAVAPFEGLGELEVAIGHDRCLRVAVADSIDERVAGLRDRTDLGPYDGMLFVFQGSTEAAFTMSGVTDPLEIAFYGNDGARNSGRLMQPCPEKAEAECPSYRADGPYEYAIETRKGQLPSGAVTACAPA